MAFIRPPEIIVSAGKPYLKNSIMGDSIVDIFSDYAPLLRHVYGCSISTEQDGIPAYSLGVRQHEARNLRWVGGRYLGL